MAVNQCLEEYKDDFSDIPGKTSFIEHKIVLTSYFLVRVKPYLISLHFRKQVNEVIHDLLRLNIIEESDSEYCTPLIEKEINLYGYAWIKDELMP